jgi:hypothetical protein
MDRQINRTPLRDALLLAGQDVEGRMLYQDYLNIVAGQGGGGPKPITEEQWEMMCDMLGGDRPMYASNVKQMLKNMAHKAA